MSDYILFHSCNRKARSGGIIISPNTVRSVNVQDFFILIFNFMILTEENGAMSIHTYISFLLNFVFLTNAMEMSFMLKNKNLLFTILTFRASILVNK